MTREDERWLKTVMTAGTLSDKIAGMQLLLSDRCVGRLEQLDQTARHGAEERADGSRAWPSTRSRRCSQLGAACRPTGRSCSSPTSPPFSLRPSASAPAPSDSDV